MRVIAKTGTEELATVYIAETGDGKKLEFVESLQPPFRIEDKWVSIISTLYGCPVGCPICDAGRDYQGKVSKADLFHQIDHLVDGKFKNSTVTSKQWKIQFARMGDPVLNPDVLEVLRELPKRYTAPGLMPSISTVAPKGCLPFLDELIDIRDTLYPEKFQMQFSIHTTDAEIRKRLIPVKTLSFKEMGEWGAKYHRQNIRKITLNFALGNGSDINPEILSTYFDPEIFIIKVTPVNPTFSAEENRIKTQFNTKAEVLELVRELKSFNYDVIVSIGEFEENAIGSNCGQYVTSLSEKQETSCKMYTYPVEIEEKKEAHTGS